MIEGLLKEGKIVPSQITVNLIKDAIMSSQADRILGTFNSLWQTLIHRDNGFNAKMATVDGFPRNLENLETWERVMQGK